MSVGNIETRGFSQEPQYWNLGVQPLSASIGTVGSNHWAPVLELQGPTIERQYWNCGVEPLSASIGTVGSNHRAPVLELWGPTIECQYWNCRVQPLSASIGTVESNHWAPVLEPQVPAVGSQPWASILKTARFSSIGTVGFRLGLVNRLHHLILCHSQHRSRTRLDGEWGKHQLVLQTQRYGNYWALQCNKDPNYKSQTPPSLSTSDMMSLAYVTPWFQGILGINTASDVSKLFVIYLGN